MPEPKQKSVDPRDYTYMQRILPSFHVPILDAERWRRTVLQQPVAGLCKTRLITYLQAADWSIEARNSDDTKKLMPEIEYYENEVLDNPELDFDSLMDWGWQDALDLPVGGNFEIVRYPPGKGPGVLKGDHPMGHVFKLEFMDGATILPTGDRELPIVQQVGGHEPIYFGANEIGRILINPRPEWRMRGFGMAPPERIFLAIMMLYYGDQYYAKLLLDTPEAGLLYLGKMEQSDALEWLGGFRELFSGINPMKIPVLYESESAPQWVPFGRPPSELTYNEVTQKYVRFVTAGYNLKPSDLGLDDGQDTLAGKIRDDRAARSTGYGVVIAKTENLINKKVLPPYLIFKIKIKDEEALIQLMRARMMAGQAAKALEETQIATAAELQRQYMLEGIFSIELKPPKEPEPEQPPPTDGTKPDDVTNELDPAAQMINELDKIPAEDGGRGDTPGARNGKGYVERAALSPDDQEMLRQQLLTQDFIVRDVFLENPDYWYDERAKFWAGDASIFDQYANVRDVFIRSLVGNGYDEEQARLIMAQAEWQLLQGSEYDVEILTMLFGTVAGS